jgi:hypothetical protein
MMILATSDLHGFLPEIPECDLLLIAGDICPDFPPTGHSVNNGEQRQRHWLDTTFRKWISKVPAKHIVAIAGNHDWVFEHPYLIPRDLPWTYLRDDCTHVGDLCIYGSPWVPNLPGWAFFGGTDGVDPEKYKDLPPDVDIMMIHGPPRGYGDRLAPSGKYGNHFEVSVGCTTMNDMLYNGYSTKAYVCGHIHEGMGHYRHNRIPGGIYNVAYVDEWYEPRGLIHEIHLDAQ